MAAVDVYVQRIQDLSIPLAESLGLTKLPESAPNIVLSAICFWTVHIFISPVLSRVFFPGSYGRLRSSRDRNNWNVHVVSLVHALIIIPLSLRCLNSPVLNADRAFGWDPRVGTLASIACGYFAWDTFESLWHFSDIGFVVHGLVCFFIYFLVFTPFIAFYGPRFLLWELSTPFLNIHWFLDKMNLTGSTLQLINGICLLTSFAGVRLIYGSIQSLEFYKTLLAIKDQTPLPVVLVYGVGNIILNSLNVLWFFKMIAALQKRMKPNDQGPPTDKKDT
ncbi:hypothetical protein PNOK_0057400 [Pyrrhoderma noxium]|uniref:TLC domain-containing protein n=1 Tax=Pyrrhoderma noxium TaxID=2282107 RepID=A0A286UV77_9AGAM|nr:hypothetical protein PNOK_0057400 [Pyrrhoderma noxium]